MVDILEYESFEQRQNRQTVAQRRKGAKQRGATPTHCIICQSQDHPVHKCKLLPSDERERTEIFRIAASTTPCWKCGEVGHFKRDCISTTSLPPLVKPPHRQLNVSHVLDSANPFSTYCNLLSSTIQRGKVRLIETRFVHNNSHAEKESNWNRGRKSIYIVAS